MKDMTVIGFGVMGKIYAKLFAQDFRVGVFSSRNVTAEAQELGTSQVDDFEEAIARSNYVAVAVPLASLAEAVMRINRSVQPGTIVFDVCSVKVPAMRILQNLKCRYFGTHLYAHNTMLVFGRVAPDIEGSLRKQGIEVKHMAAEEHDRLNAIHGLAHFLALAVDDTLSREDRAVLAGSGAGSKLLSLIQHVTSNAPATYRETQLDNPFMRTNRLRLLTGIKDYHAKLERGEFVFHPTPFRRHQ